MHFQIFLVRVRYSRNLFLQMNHQLDLFVTREINAIDENSCIDTGLLLFSFEFFNWNWLDKWRIFTIVSTFNIYSFNEKYTRAKNMSVLWFSGFQFNSCVERRYERVIFSINFIKFFALSRKFRDMYEPLFRVL